MTRNDYDEIVGKVVEELRPHLDPQLKQAVS